MPDNKKSRYTESQKRSSLKYAKEKLKRIPLDVQLSKYEEIRSTAESVNESVNGFIKKAVDDRIDSIKGLQDHDPE